jgi:hypothetical protein
MTTCIGPQCEREVQARGMCHSHFEMQRRNPGRELRPLRPTEPRARFFAQVVKQSDGCWIWTGSTDGKGRYGSFQFDGRNLRTHRASYEWAKGPIPEGRVLDHLCKTTLCVNPDHLEPVTQHLNIIRGDGWGGTNSRKTHCPQGHPYDEANTYITPCNGGRICRACQKARRTPASKVAGRWLIEPDDLAAYVETQANRPKPRQRRRRAS